ncbi:TetR family transcriptional regulator [Microbispora rosea subsp. aerata]|nr:helix-turn-helix domain-containing protein [Microbispora rosea]GGO11002.1 TetR family transcriptional regulator [Microbispora rosea subsp. aerata]GIH53606.1 TetR family transcriptional regulator [Microbispora rosea subsp. aerata]GLJ86263.1 TetR family transcriptional regulator [Microbispora rosea subsp. aerata]
MERLTRAELQARNRAKVLAAAREEFAERGFRDAKVDAIADRAGLTRGAVYSNFPGKRALYFSVLADLAEREAGRDAADPPAPAPGERPATGPSGAVAPGAATAGEALAAFARAWVSRLPLATDQPSRLGMDLMPEVLADQRVRLPFAQLMKLNALVLGLALERLDGAGHAGGRRRVRVAEVALTTLYGASQMADAAPGFAEPFDVVAACAALADLDLGDRWDAPHLPFVPRARPADEPWSPPPAVDALAGGPAPLAGDGVVAVLGLHRLGAVEEAVRAAPPAGEVTVAVVTGDPGELGPLARLTVAELRSCLRRAVPAPAWPRLRVVHDEEGAVAAAAGVSAVSDGTEAAVRVRSGRVVARADGYGACHAAASARP